MRALKLKKEQYLRRRKRSKAFANKDEMRLCIFKSTNHIEAKSLMISIKRLLFLLLQKRKSFQRKSD